MSAITSNKNSRKTPPTSLSSTFLTLTLPLIAGNSSFGINDTSGVEFSMKMFENWRYAGFGIDFGTDEQMS